MPPRKRSTPKDSPEALHPGALFFEDFTVGRVFLTPRRTITEADIHAFAGLSGDFNPLHTDAVFAAGTPFGRPIAHGLLGLSIATGLQSRLGVIDGTALAFLECRWKFTKPTYAGDTLRARGEVSGARRSVSHPDRGIVVLEVSLMNQDGEEVQRGSWTFMVRSRG